MKLIGNTINGNYLRDLLPSTDDDVDGVLAALAYGNDANNDTVLKNFGND